MSNLRPAHPKAPSPPRTASETCVHRAHGSEWSDPYSWLRAQNWREVLRDVAALPAGIRTHLEAENAYSDAILAPTKALQRELVREMRARLKEDDSEVPQNDGPYAYYARFRHGGQHRIHCRKPRSGGKETILLDGDALAEGKAFFQLSNVRHSPDHAMLAWVHDDAGSELHTITVRDLTNDVDLPDVVEHAGTDIVWTCDGRAFLYVAVDDNHRPFKVALHRLGTSASDDSSLFEESDPALFLSVAPTRLGRRAVISVHGHDFAEIRLVDLEAPHAPPRLVAPRRSGHRYQVMDHGDALFIRTNAGDARDFRICRTCASTPEDKNWREFLPHRDGRLIEAASIFRDFLVLLTREDNIPRFEFVEIASGARHELAFDAETYFLRAEPVHEFESTLFRFAFSSLACTQETYDYDMKRRVKTLRKKQMEPKDFDASTYVVRRLNATAEDGEIVPISLIHKNTTSIDGTAPLLVYGYGAYGHVIDANFSTNRLSLVDRGFVFALAHVRGGTEKGWRWYEEGKLAAKSNTFEDFLTATRALVAAGYGASDKVVAQGGSAGGMVMGVVANRAPELFAGIIAEVPFVDVLNTMMDAELPLTPPEWLEWGDPIRDASAFERIRSYSPYDNLRPVCYPAIFVAAGLSDPRVTYWEPAKWVARLRAVMTGGGPILLRTLMEGGHAGSPGRFDRLEEVARAYAFALSCVQKTLAKCSV